jgi:hypothetical protein
MNFLNRKISRLGLQQCNYRVTVKPITLDLETEFSGEVYLQLKRGKHKDKSLGHKVMVTPGGGKQ